jgi:hypothetical protein
VDVHLDDLQAKFDKMVKPMNNKHSTVESLLQGMNLPFTAKVMELPLPLKFKMPQIFHVQWLQGSRGPH